MTQSSEPANVPADDGYLVVAALADGEPVDSSALRIALADPAARDYLIDLIALRQAVGAVSASGGSGWQPRARQRSRVRWVTAAAAVLISLTASYFAGQRSAPQIPSSPTIETAIDVGTSPVAPEPTHVVTLRPGVNWTETSGGH